MSNKIAGNLLCVLPIPEPKGVLDRIRQKYPELKITYICTKEQMGDWKGVGSITTDTWNEIDYLCTLLEFPENLNIAPKLKFIHLISAGADHVWSKAIFTDSDVPIFTSNGIHGPTIGEWVMMMLLVTSRGYEQLHQVQLKQDWNVLRDYTTFFENTYDSVGRRMGILGYGSIGRQIGRLASSMGMEVYVHTASPRDTPDSRRDYGFVIPGTGDPDGTFPTKWFSGDSKAALHDFLGQDLDFIVVSVPLTDKTRSLLGKVEFDILARRNAFVVNIARGDIIVQEALIEALKAFEDDKDAAEEDRPRKGLRGAALDVATPEPLPKDDPLWTAPNCIVTPHMSGVHADYLERSLQVLQVNLEREAKGQKLINLVSRSSGYAHNTA